MTEPVTALAIRDALATALHDLDAATYPDDPGLAGDADTYWLPGILRHPAFVAAIRAIEREAAARVRELEAALRGTPPDHRHDFVLTYACRCGATSSPPWEVRSPGSDPAPVGPCEAAAQAEARVRTEAEVVEAAKQYASGYAEYDGGERETSDPELNRLLRAVAALEGDTHD